jgi:lysyl-tRNA synthetase, class I
MYRTGRYNGAVKTALTKRDDIAKIIGEFSGKSISYGWSPFNPRCDKCGKLTKTAVKGFNPEAETVDYACACGNSGTVSAAGGGKLTWQVEWPASWAILGITIEPFGKDFGKENESKGGSYDTAKQITKEIFMYKAPYPVVCEHITPGKPGIKHSSTGAPVSISDMLEVMPPEFLRYLIIRTKPEKRLYIDPVQSILAFAEEYERLRARFREKDPSFGIFEKRIYELSRLTKVSQSEIPFKQMTTIYQVARGDFDQILKIVSRSGFSTENEKCIKELTDNVSRWLELYAPPYVKFNVKENVPVQVATLSELQKAFLSAFSALIKARKKLSGNEYHKLIYSAKEDGSELNRKITEKINTQVKRQTDSRDAAPQIDPGYLFKAIYISLLGQSSGPRAGWFISSLDKEFLIKRFEEASTYSPGKR